jgi:hypothetical protein
VAFLCAVPAAASATPHVQSAVEYDGTIELTFDESVEQVSLEKLWVNGISKGSVASDATVTMDPDDDQRATIELPQAYSSGVTLEVRIDVETPDGDQKETTNTVETTNIVIQSGESTGTPTVYQGEVIALLSNQTDKRVTFGNTVDTTRQNSTVYHYDTGSLAPGIYDVEFESGAAASFEVRESSLTLTTDGNITAADNITADIESNRSSGAFTVSVLTSDEELVRSEDGRYMNGTATVDLGRVDGGDYTVEVEDPRTRKTDSASVTVSCAGGCGTLVHIDGVTREHAGDVAHIDLELVDTDEATMTIGSRDDGYYANLHLTDGDGDGEVTVAFNSYTAGASQADRPVWAVDPADSVELVAEGGAFQTDDPAEDTLDPGEYSVNASGGHYSYETADSPGREISTVSLLHLEERTAGNVTIWRAPGHVDVGSLSASDLQDRTAPLLTDADTIATQDLLLVELNTTGVAGQLANAETESERLAILTQKDRGLSLTAKQTNPAAGDDAHEIDFEATTTAVVTDPKNDTYYILRPVQDEDATGSSAVEPGNEYAVNHSLSGDSDFTGTPPRTAPAFEIVETDVSIPAGNQTLDLRPTSGQALTGQTTIAPGSTITLNLSGEGGNQIHSAETTVEQTEMNGAATFGTAVDLSAFAGETVTVWANATGAADSVESQVGVNASQAPLMTNETNTPSNTTAIDTAETRTATTTATNITVTAGGSDPATEANGPGFGVSIAVLVPIALALLASRGVRQ